MREPLSAGPLGNVRIAGLLALLSLGCLAMLVVRPVVANETRFLFLLWNLFLAWLPYAASIAATAVAGRGRFGPIRLLVVLALGALWLLFLPNGAYLTTDFIHLIEGRRRYVEGGEYGYLVWFDLILFFLLSWCGLFLSYVSTRQFHRLVAVRFGRLVGWAFVSGVTLLAGYGVFLGRIVRLNSWDAWMRPLELIGSILGNLHWRGAAFSLLFSGLMGVTYLFLYHLQDRDR
jgi:uncharacterized membrane protein